MNKKIKVMLLADPFSPHINKWANALDDYGIEITIYGLSEYIKDQFNPDIDIEIFEIPQSIKWRKDGDYLKAAYLFGLPKLLRFIKQKKCNILHAHSASSYGFLGALTNFHPYPVSVWGNDVYEFPQRGSFHKNILKFNLSRADWIFSTSKVMKAETEKYTSRKVEVISFGIDIDKFQCRKRMRYNDDDIVIGTVKSLEKKYGSEDILECFIMLKNKYPRLNLKLLMVGRGSLEQKLKMRSLQSGMQEDICITGYIPYNQVPEYHNMLDIYLAPSIEMSETFGVAIIEASACRKPVIVTNMGGLPEVVIDNKTGYIIEPGDRTALFDKIEYLVLNKDERTRLGNNGRQFVEDKYNFKNNLTEMISFYEKMVK